MLYQSHPHTGEWFRAANGELFEVVDIDVDTDTIEIQHFDGTLEGMDIDSWHALYAQPIGPPEDISGSLDMPAEDLEPWESTAPYRANPLDLMD